MTIESIVDDLRAYAQLEPGTFYTARKLMNERRMHPDAVERQTLRNEWYYTANGYGYFVDGDKVEWAITDEAHNLVLQNLDHAFTSLTRNDNYRPDNDAAKASYAASGTLRVDMSSLRLSGTDNEGRYLAIETATGRIKSGEEYVAPNDTERAVLDRLGYTIENLAMLSQEGRITETKIYVLNPVYVKTEVAKDSEKRTSLWRASRLRGFGLNSSLYASDHLVGGRGRLRGVRWVEARSAVAPEGEVPGAPVVPSEIKLATFDEVRAYASTFIDDALVEEFEAGLKRLYNL